MLSRWVPVSLLLCAAVLLHGQPAAPSTEPENAADPAETAAAVPAKPAGSNARPAAETASPGAKGSPQPIRTTLELQVELHRRGFSCGSIDGAAGAQTAAALRAFQRYAGIAETGRMDAATREVLQLSGSALTEHTIDPTEIGSVHPVPATWVEKAQLDRLGYGSVLEMIAERYHAHPNLLRRLNPNVNWSAILPGTTVIVPATENVVVMGTPAQIVISLGERELDVLDDTSRVVAHFPVSIAHNVEKRPVGELHISMLIPNPDYTFDPAIFSESAEARAIGHKLVVPPGPNNPVGVAWIALDRPGYGIHGTPEPEHVGRTESHGCFRLANWDVQTLLRLVHVGMTVQVEP